MDFYEFMQGFSMEIFMYWMIALVFFFTIPPVGLALLLTGVVVNLLINLIDYIHHRRHKPTRQRRQYS